MRILESRSLAPIPPLRVDGKQTNKPSQKTPRTTISSRENQSVTVTPPPYISSQSRYWDNNIEHATTHRWKGTNHCTDGGSHSPMGAPKAAATPAAAPHATKSRFSRSFRKSWNLENDVSNPSTFDLPCRRRRSGVSGTRASGRTRDRVSFDAEACLPSETEPPGQGRVATLDVPHSAWNGSSHGEFDTPPRAIFPATLKTVKTRGLGSGTLEAR